MIRAFESGLLAMRKPPGIAPIVVSIDLWQSDFHSYQ